MEKHNNIFTKLEDNIVQPPDMLYEAIRRRIAVTKKVNLITIFDKLAKHSATPPSHLEAAIIHKIEGQ